jgi:uncharacterized protein (TIGR03086 family)
MNRFDVLASALRTFRDTVAQTPADGWELPTPCAGWSTTQVLQHAAGDQLGWAGIVGTGPMPTEDPFAPSGTLDGAPLELADRAVAAATAAWDAVDPAATELPTPLPPTPVLPAELAAGACALDAAVHAWDLAVATGRPSPLTAEVAAALLPAAKATVEPLRGWAYAAELPAEAGDGPVETLLRYLGRDPRWSA